MKAELVPYTIVPLDPNYSKPFASWAAEWQEEVDGLRSDMSGISDRMWRLGDLWNFGEEHYGEQTSQVLDADDIPYSTFRSAGWVASKFPSGVRRLTDLSWSHHQAASSLDSEQADMLLAQAVDEGWTTRELKEKVRASKQKALAAPSKWKPGICECCQSQPRDEGQDVCAPCGFHARSRV